jgi:hypothetical protein
MAELFRIKMWASIFEGLEFSRADPKPKSEGHIRFPFLKRARTNDRKLAVWTLGVSEFSPASEDVVITAISIAVLIL